MLFRKRRDRVPPFARKTAPPEQSSRPESFRIDFDMMLKGSVLKRRGRPIRQFGVTVHGATRLVTSGDVVDRPTYEALLAVGAIRQPAPQEGVTSAVETRPDPPAPD